MDYLPTYKAFHRRLLEEVFEDNVMYLEMRTGMSGVCHFLELKLAFEYESEPRRGSSMKA